MLTSGIRSTSGGSDASGLLEVLQQRFKAVVGMSVAVPTTENRQK